MVSRSRRDRRLYPNGEVFTGNGRAGAAFRIGGKIAGGG
jgi:hypothetical protein